MENKTFILTDDHVKLLRRMWVNWQDAETGAPEIDPKRPYGNSAVAQDVVEILGWVGETDAEGALDENTFALALRLHRELDVALQIVLRTGEFTTGFYECERYSGEEWERVGPA